MTQLLLISLALIAGIFLEVEGCCNFPTHSKSAITNLTEANYKCDEPVTITCLSSASMSDTNRAAVTGLPVDSEEYRFNRIASGKVAQNVWCDPESNKWRIENWPAEYEKFACSYLQWIVDI